MHIARCGSSHSPISQKLIILRVAVIAALAILPVFALVTPVASMNDPDSSPSVTNIHINRNLVTNGDWLIYASYDIPYAVSPNATSADNAFIFRLMDTDGVTELAAIAPYAYSEFDDGYNEGNIFFYSTGGLAWNSAYIIRISENPTQFASPTYWDFPISATAYTSSATQADNQEELANNIIAMADGLETAYHLSMTESYAGGEVLSSPYGERYYRGACYGIQAMAPTLFWVQLVQLDLTSTNWTRTQADAWETPLSGTWYESGENATAAQFGLTRLSIEAIVVVFLLSVGIFVLSSMKFKRVEPALVSISILLILSLLMGWIPAAVFASIFQLMAIYTGYLWFFARS